MCMYQLELQAAEEATAARDLAAAKLREKEEAAKPVVKKEEVAKPAAKPPLIHI